MVKNMKALWDVTATAEAQQLGVQENWITNTMDGSEDHLVRQDVRSLVGGGNSESSGTKVC